MSESGDRLEQFRKMAEADPSNELGHFSLGQEYLRAGRAAEAVPAFERVVALKPEISKAYHSLAMALAQSGRKDDAVARLTQGVKIAHARGDLMPRNDMVKMLNELGAPVPDEVQQAASAPAAEVGAAEVLCKRCGRVATKLEKPPFRGPFGQQVFENTCKDCWREAIGMGTKVINELRLPLSDPQAQKVWDTHIREFLNL